MEDIMEDIFKAIDEAFDGEPSEEYINPVHGKIVSRRFEPYHDVTVYEDGHEEWFSIGD